MSGLLFKLLMGKGGGGGPTLAPMFASALNYKTNSRSVVSTSTRRFQYVRYKVVIGSSDFSSLKILFEGSRFSFGDATIGNNYSIVECALEKETGGSAFTPVYFSGVRTATVVDGTLGVFSDPILPSSFGLGSFTRGDIYWIRAKLQVAATGMYFPGTSFVPGNSNGQIALSYDPVTTGVSAVDGTGVPTYGTGTGGSGPTDFSFSSAHTPILIGTPLSANAKYLVGIGDSIVVNTGDTTGAGADGLIKGFFLRSLFNSDFATGVRAGLNYGLFGGSGDSWTGAAHPNASALLVYGNVAIEEYGTNSVRLASDIAIWTELNALNYKIIRTKLLTITTSTDGWVTTENQSKVAAWTSPSGSRPVFNDGLSSYVGVKPGGFDVLVSFDAAVLHTDRDIWQAGATIDGTHPTSAAHEAMAAVMRSVYSALP